MATWTNIANTSLEPGSPARSVDAFALRDNPIAIAQGAAGAPRIQTNAIQNSAVTADKLATGERMTTANVLARTASASTGAVGTYAFLGRSGTNIAISAGSTVAGSNLRYLGVNVAASAASLSTGSTVGGTPSGTWRAMGHCQNSDVSRATTVWLRIS